MEKNLYVGNFGILSVFVVICSAPTPAYVEVKIFTNKIPYFILDYSDSITIGRMKKGRRKLAEKYKG